MRQIRYQDSKISNKTPSKGNQGKYHIEDEWIKTDYLGYEAASEYLASELLRNSNILHYVKYSLDKIQIENKNGFFRNMTGCISQDFLKNGGEIVTLDKFLKQILNTTFEKEIKGKSTKDAIQHIVNLVEENTGIHNFGNYLTAMFEFDAFILNEDRHVQNIVLINKNGQYEPGPIFDNGAAFLSDIEQEYPLEEKTNRLINCVKAKPFNSSFDKQVKACHELYGKQLSLTIMDISSQIDKIKFCYGDRIANRIQHIYDIQLNKCKDILQLNEPEKKEIVTEEPDFLYNEKQMAKEIVDYIENGGNIVTKAVPELFVTPLKDALIEEEIPFITMRDENNICSFYVKDMDSRDFLKIQKEVFQSIQPPKLEPESTKATQSKVSQILQIEDYDER